MGRIRVRTDASAAQGVASRMGIRGGQTYIIEPTTGSRSCMYGDVTTRKVDGTENLVSALTTQLDATGNRVASQGVLGMITERGIHSLMPEVSIGIGRDGDGDGIGEEMGM